MKRLNVFDIVDCRASIDAAFAANDSLSKYPNVLNMFIEEDDYPLLGA
jgi:hypothetical protein